MDSLEPHSFFMEGLEKSGLPYCITGSFASGVYGENRQTKDIDLIVLLRSADIARFQAVFPQAEY